MISPPDANRVEAWNISITETENTLWNDGADSGGELGLLIDVWDHFDAELNTVSVESPGNFGVPSPASPIGGGAGYSTYYINIDNATPDEDSIDILIEAACEATGYQGIIPGEKVTAYFIHASDVSPNSPSNSNLHIINPDGGESLMQDCPYEIEWESSGDPIADVKLEYSTDGFIADVNEIVASTPNDGFYDWEVPAIESDTVRVRVSDVLNAAVKDISDDDLSVDAPGEPIWPTYKYDVSRHGISPNVGPSTNHIEWTFHCTTQTTPGPSIGWDGTIYIGTNDGHFHAVYPDGTERFTLALGSFILGTPAIAPDGTVYAGTWGAAPKLYAIRCEGDIEWEFDANNNFNKCHPVIGDDGTIYIGDNGGRFYAINPDGTEKWHYDSNGGFVPSPCIGPDGEIYFAMVGSTIYGFNDLGQGSYDLFWQHVFPGEHMGNSPSVDGDGHVYCCGLYLNTVWVCDPDTDTILWTFDAPDGFDEASVSIDTDGTIYIGCNDYNMYAVNPGGSVKWSTPVGGRVPSSVIIDPAGHLYFGTRDIGVFYCLNKTNGNVIWSYPTGETIRCTAAIAPDGTLYVGGHDGLLKAFKDE